MRRTRTYRQQRVRAGISLVEVSVSTLLIGLVIVTALHASAGAVRNWSAASEEFQIAQLADQLMAEIRQNVYEEPDDPPVFGREAGEAANDRSAWDDTDDFDGWTASPPTAADGSPLTEFTGWTRSVTVRLAAISDPLTTPVSDEGLKMIEVTVTSPGGQTLVRQSLRSRWGASDQTPYIDTTWITSASTSFTLQNGITSSTQTSLPNAAEDQP